MKTERTPTRAFRVQSTLTSQSPEAGRSRMALDQRESSPGALDLERALSVRVMEPRLQNTTTAAGQSTIRRQAIDRHLHGAWRECHFLLTPAAKN